MSARIGIAGLGLIGGSLLRGLAGAGRAVTGFDADPAVRERAQSAGFSAARGLDDLAAQSDVVFVAVPPRAVAQTVAAALAASPEVVVADCTSFKQRVVDDVRDATGPAELERFVPAHPLAGGHVSGWDAARPDLLHQAFWAVCPTGPDAGAGPLCEVAAALDDLDSRLLVCTPADHDDALARTSHVPHVAAQALVHLVGHGNVPLRAALSGGGYRDTTRIAEADPALWAEVLAANGGATVDAIDALTAELGALREAIVSDDPVLIEAAWRKGRELRDVVEHVRWGTPAWTSESTPWPAWDRLLELGRAGRAVRHLRLTGDGTALEFEAAV